MSIKALVPTLISIILQYSLLVVIYYFLFCVIKFLYHDLKDDAAGQLNTAGVLIVVNTGAATLTAGRYALQDRITLGRNPSCDIVIDDEFVSYDHACIAKYHCDYWLTDLNSTNRTYLNGRLVANEILLHAGDMIKIGTVTFKFER